MRASAMRMAEKDIRIQFSKTVLSRTCMKQRTLIQNPNPSKNRGRSALVSAMDIINVNGTSWRPSYNPNREYLILLQNEKILIRNTWNYYHLIIDKDIVKEETNGDRWERMYQRYVQLLFIYVINLFKRFGSATISGDDRREAHCTVPGCSVA